ncbi:MAG: polysaccharide biosynthesis C-terminal domain-containing protein [Lewinellaceae bacterium]|nr:polysaccharide biosynthesis C-terminal domain-containing protein [Lewinella sp.]MCB9279132.1 polysaccharide biosynthesis C-terminal domain-containing protein [Lewinellaceae bacterium]
MANRLLRAWMTNVKALQAFHIMRQGAVLAVAVLLAKSGLSTDDIGIYEKLLYIGFLLSAFWISGLTQGLLSLFPKLEPSERPVFLWNTYLFLTGLGLLLLGICLVFERQVLLVLTSAPDLPYYRLFIWYLAIQLPAFLLENVYLLKDKPMSNFRFGIFSGLGYLLAVALPPFIGLDFRWSFYGLIGLAVIKHIWLISCLLGLGKPGYDRGIMSRWLMLSWPLVGYALIAGLNQSLDGWLISFQFPGNDHLFAVFRYGAREMPFVIAMTAAFSSAMIPLISGDLASGMETLKVKSRKLFHLLFPPSIVLILTSRWLIPLVFNRSFEESVPIFNMFILILISRLVFSRTVMIALDENKAALWILLVEIGANLILSWMLLQWIGLIGAAVGTVLAFTLEKILAAVYLYRKHGISPGKYLDLPVFLGYSALLMIAFLAAFRIQP